MYTEIVKIIEGGLVNDKEKVINYAKILATNLEQQGEIALAKRIRGTLTRKSGTLTSLDGFSTKPVDVESRMDIVDIRCPKYPLKMSFWIDILIMQFVILLIATHIKICC